MYMNYISNLKNISDELSKLEIKNLKNNCYFKEISNILNDKFLKIDK